MRKVTFIGGPRDGKKAVPPTPVETGEYVAIKQPDGFAVYRRMGDIMQFIETVSSVEVEASTHFGHVKFGPPES